MSVVTPRQVRRKKSGPETRVVSAQAATPPPRPIPLSPVPAFGLPFAFTLGLAAFGLLDPVRENPRLLWAFWGAAAILLAWSAILLVEARRAGRTLAVAIEPRKQHYLQACAQLSVLSYWGWYWSPCTSRPT